MTGSKKLLEQPSMDVGTGSKLHSLCSESCLPSKSNMTGSCSERSTLPFPPELIQEIFQHLNKHDLKKCRLVSKTIAENVSPSLLFNTIFLSNDSHDLDGAKNILNNFKASVETIIWSPLVPDANRPSCAEFTRRFKRSASYKQFEDSLPKVYAKRSRTIKSQDASRDDEQREIGAGQERTHRYPQRSYFKEHIKIAWERYCKAFWHPGSTADFHKVLENLLPGTHPRRLIITDRLRYTCLERPHMSGFCRWDDCSLQPHLHDMFRVSPVDLWDDDDRSQPRCALHNLTYIMRYSNPDLQELVVEQGKAGSTHYELKFAVEKRLSLNGSLTALVGRRTFCRTKIDASLSKDPLFPKTESVQSPAQAQISQFLSTSVRTLPAQLPQNFLASVRALIAQIPQNLWANAVSLARVQIAQFSANSARTTTGGYENTAKGITQIILRDHESSKLHTTRRRHMPLRGGKEFYFGVLHVTTQLKQLLLDESSLEEESWGSFQKYLYDLNICNLILIEAQEDRMVRSVPIEMAKFVEPGRF